MSDNELDNLFKEAAEGYKVPDDSSAWNGMATRLDQAVHTPSFWNWKTITTLSVVGVTGLSVLWYSFSVDSKLADSNSSFSEISSTVSTDKDEVAETQPSGLSSQDKGLNNSLEEASDNSKTTSLDLHQSRNKDESEFNKDKVFDAEQGFQPKKLKTNSESSHSNSISKGIIETNGTTRTEETSTILDRNINAVNIIQAPNSTEKYQVLSKEFKQEQVSEEVKASQGNAALNKNFLNSDVATDSLLKEASEKLVGDSLKVKNTNEVSEKESILIHRLSIKLSVSPDFSSVKLFSPDKPGINYGALLGYNFNNRWSVFTGAISSRKIYSSTEIDEPYTNSSGYDYPVNKLEGDCRVIDIPVNVYYSFNQNRSLSFKIGLGVSSYLMRSEDYVYHVDNPYGSDVYSQSVDRKNNEWFKMLNMSVVVQKKLSNQFYLELEPFLKAPMAGVGEGKVSLVSLGAFLSLRYDFNLNFKK